MRMLVVGAGATGGYFGGRLVQAGRDVTFLVRPGRASELRSNGLQIVSPRGNVTLQPRLVSANAVERTYDVVLLTVKGFALEAALDDIAPAIGRDTMILPVLNGMRQVDLLEAHFGKRNVIGGVCKVATTLDDRGRIIQLAGFQDLSYGEMDGTASARVIALDAFMQGAGFDVRLSPAIAREMWEKWILLATMSGITCLMRGTIGEIEAVHGGVAFVHRLLDEVSGIATQVGEKPDETFLAQARQILTAKGSPQTSSMYRDLQNGRRLELDQIIGDLVARAHAAAIVSQLLETVMAHLSVYEDRRNAVSN